MDGVGRVYRQVEETECLGNRSRLPQHHVPSFIIQLWTKMQKIYRSIVYSNSNLFSELWDGPKYAFASLFLDALGKRSQKKTPFFSGIAHIRRDPPALPDLGV